MLQPGHLTHSRTHSFENNTPPPYIQSQDDIFSGQDNNAGTGRAMGKEHEQLQEYDDDDLLAHVDHIHDPAVLKRLLIQKEQERQGLSLNLDMAARLGLDLHQQLQRCEIESAAKLQSLQHENLALQSKANQSQELSYQLANSEQEVKELRGKNRFLQRELDTCRQELKTFRKDLDQLSEHMTQISAEMFEAKNKVNSYARRLGEVEQELVQTKELNVNLQAQLDNALQKQKQTQSSTTQVVKMIQSDLGRVFSDRDTMQLTLEELETRQMQCEGKVVEMMTNTREYAQLLEEAQETIHTMRIESDMEGRGWSGRGHHAAIWDNKTGEQPVSGDDRPRNSRQLTASPTSISRYGTAALSDELDPMFNSGSWDRHHPGGVNSLEQELGIGTLDRELAGGFPRGLDQELQGFHYGGSLEDELRGFDKPAGSLGDELRGSGHGSSLQSELRGFHQGMSLDQELRGFDRGESLEQEFAAAQDPISEPALGSLASELAAQEKSPESSVAGDTPTDAASEEAADEEIIRKSMDEDEGTYVTYIPQRLSLSAELHQRLEENNILQTVLTGRATWNVHSTIGITSAHSPNQNTPTTFRDIGRTLSMMTLPNQKSLPHPKNRIPSPLSSPKIPPASKASESSSTRSVSSSGSSAGSLQGSSITDPSEVQNILGLKYLLSASSSADLSNVITKTHTKTPAANIPSPLREKKTTTRLPAPQAAAKEKHGHPSSTKDGQSSTLPSAAKSSDTTTTTTSTVTATSTSSSTTAATTTSGRPTPSRPIAFGSAVSGARSGHKSTSPASSWSSSSSTSSIPRRPSLAPNSGSFNSGKPKPPTTNN
ncbi:hypothetical protein BGZ96_002659 [Linnemannia gamsii]|uniref:Uncharacterized protein n=1 Tax=Linnemannia gamsii TaxID=64522 RepID=A0ABQ7K7R9_9FUNG|nr:hypothetical protein BGZ96_002659 [Linnemannia gamsii]